MNYAFPETFLHHIWQYKLFDTTNLYTIEGDAIQLLQVGTQNHHAGPDFTNARIKIGSTLWAGSVEIHKRSSDWYAHQHEVDQAYDNTILHVVYEYDQAIIRTTGSSIATLVLKDKIPAIYLERYWTLLQETAWIPCAVQFKAAMSSSSHAWATWLDVLLKERLAQRIITINKLLEQTTNDWETTFYYVLARSFGMKPNTNPFEALAQSLPLKVLAKHKHNLRQLECLLLGQAGFLSGEMPDPYAVALQKEYHFLRQKYKLVPLQACAWKFGRMRPANFPTIRLAQFAVLIHQSQHLFTQIIKANSITILRSLFKIKLNGYWDHHYQLGDMSVFRPKKLGKQTVELLIVNTIIPFLFVYGRAKGHKEYQERALDFMKQLKPDNNTIITGWKRLGVTVQTAHDSQALLQLKTTYCDHKRCLECQVGNSILRAKD